MPPRLRYRYRLTKAHTGRMIDRHQRLVVPKDSAPVGIAVCFSDGVFGSNASLQMVAGQLVASARQKA